MQPGGCPRPETADAPADRIEKKVRRRAPRKRVWPALTGPARGPITYPGYEHVTLEITIEKMEPERLFSRRWHPGAVDTKHDYSKDPTTLVVFTLEDKDGGTLLTVVESGFDQVPSAYRATALRSNRGGWAEQMKNIERHVSANPAT